MVPEWEGGVLSGDHALIRRPLIRSVDSQITVSSDIDPKLSVPAENVGECVYLEIFKETVRRFAKILLIC